MGLSLYTSHIKTIVDLQALCEKHNCYFLMGEDHTSSLNVGNDIEEFFKDKVMIRSILDKCVIETSSIEDEYIWFEFYDIRNDKCGGLRIRKSNLYLELKKYAFEIFSNEEEDFICENQVDWCSGLNEPIFVEQNQTENTWGVFEGKETNCYREGICLREFSNLVCDYLGEPRIVRTY